MLTDKIRLSGPEDSTPEDYLSSSLAVIFPDDITNQHGDAEHTVIYSSPSYGDIHLALADPQGDDNRRLFSHFLWNAGLQLAEFIEERDEWTVQGERVLELGAGTGLSGIVAAKSGAEEVVITDYPAPEVLANIQTNISKNLPAKSNPSPCRVQGHEWGLVDPETDDFVRDNEGKFTRILVADCLWMPWQHRNLMKSIAWFLAPKGRAWVIAGFHTGREKMRGFYDRDILGEEGLATENIYERDAEGNERDWKEDRGREDVTARKRWLVVGVLRRRAA